MNCESYRTQWHEHADGELSGADAAALHEHAAHCDACRRYDAQMRAVFAGLDRLRDRPLALTPSRRRIHTFAPARIAAAVVLFIGASWLLSSAVRDDTPPNGRVEQLASRPQDAGIAEPSFELTGESATTYLAMARPSSEPTVRMYWLYRVSDEQTQ